MDPTTIALTVALGLIMVVFVRAMRENTQTPPGTILPKPQPKPITQKDATRMARDLVRRRDRLRRFKAET